EGVIAGLLLYDFVMANQERLAELLVVSPKDPEKVGNALFGETRGLVCRDLKLVASCLVPQITREQLRCSAADYILWSLNSFGDSQEKRLHRLNEYFNTYTIGRDVQDCNLVVRARREDDVISRLQRDLNEGIELFAYSISPKNLAKRVSSSITTQELMEILVGKPVEVSTTATSAGVESQRTRAQRRDAVEVQATVVSLGSSQNYLKRSAPSNTDFGWAVIPRKEDSDLSLTAVISVPGWWRSALLIITNCWVTRDQLKNISNVQDSVALSVVQQGSVAPTANDLCKIGTAITSRQELIRLPGSVEEVSRKLGFEVVQEPYLDDDQLASQVLYAGHQGEILLTGGRLWRSTEVTLG